MIQCCKNKLHDWSESNGKKIGLDLNYFIKSGFWITFRYGFVSLFGLALSIGFARLATKELLGEYQMILAFLSLISIFSLPGLNLSALKSVTRGDDGAVVKAVRLSFLGSLMALPFIAGYAAYIFFIQGNSLIGLAFLLGAFFFPFFYAFNTWYVFYEARSIFYPVTWRVTLLSLLTTLGLLGALSLQANLLMLLAIYFGVNSLFNGIFFWEVWKRVKKEKKREESLDIGYGLSVSGQKFVFSLAENLPVLALSFLFGFETLALFQIAYFFISAIAGLMSGLSAAYLPLLFRYKKLAYGRVLVQNIVIGIILFVVFRIFLEVFFIFMYGEAYRESLSIARNLSFLLIFFPLKTFLLNFLTTQSKNLAIVITFLFANAVSLAVLYTAKNIPFPVSVSFYLYALNISLVIPLLFIYFSIASRKVASMRSEMIA